MIDIQNLSFHYKAKNPVYSGLNMVLQRGNIYGLLGENGVGKTTLLKLISGLLFPTEGQCTVLGFVPKRRDPRMLENIYLLPEVFTLPKIKMSEYVKLYAPFYPQFNHAQLAEYVVSFGLSTLYLDKYLFVEYLFDKTIIEAMDNSDVNMCDVDVKIACETANQLLKNKVSLLSDFFAEIAEIDGMIENGINIEAILDNKQSKHFGDFFNEI